MSDAIVIVGAARTPIGSFLGAFKDVAAPQLGACAIRAALERATVKSKDVDEVMMGCVLSAGLGQAPARQAAIGAGVPQSTGCVTVNKVCGSSLKAVMFAHDSIKAGTNTIVVAGGMESMSGAPYLMKGARAGLKFGHKHLLDHMQFDGLEDAYEGGRAMGCFADDTAKKYDFSRAAQDTYALESLAYAKKAQDEGWFEDEIVPFVVEQKKHEMSVVEDELPKKARPDKIPHLKPAFSKEGTVTAASSSGISDGGAAVVLMSESEAQARRLQPLAKIVAHATHAQAPEWFTTAPVGALQKLMDKTGWSTDDVDLFEVNEAFAVVAMAAMHDLKIPREKLNAGGGACALGHPIGASGARILVTLIHGLKRTGGKRGMASLCLGGGEAVGVAVEMMG